MGRKLAYLVVMALFVAVLPLHAQEDTTTVVAADSLAMEQVDSTASVLMNRSIGDLKMQPRYRPVNQPFHKGGILSNTYLTIMGSGYRQFADNYSNGPILSAGLDKWFTRFSGMRLMGGYGRFFDNYDATRVAILAFRANYLFNLSAFVDGYDPDRLVEFYPVAGVGFNVNRGGGVISAGLCAQMGAEIMMHVLPGIDLVVDPMLELAKDSRGLARMDVWRRYLLGLNLGVGARVALDKERWGGDPGGDWFFTLQGGVQLQNSDLERDIRLGKAIGALGLVGAGRYYGRAFALRVQGGYSWHYWKEIKEGDTDITGAPLQPALFRSSYALLRMDGVLDFVALFSRNGQKRFGLSALAGPEAGIMLKEDPYHANIRYPYIGFSGALQAKVNVWSGLSLFIEPRVSIVPYSAYAFKSSTVNRNYYDAVVNVSFGVEYRLKQQ